MPWYQYLLIDVITFGVLIIIIFILIIKFFVKIIYKIVKNVTSTKVKTN